MLSQLLTPACIKAGMESTEKDEAFEELVEVVAVSNAKISREEVLAALSERESKMTTGILPGLAVPHAVCSSISDAVLVVGTSSNGIEWNSLDGKPVHAVFMLLFAPGMSGEHLQAMKEVAELLQHPDFVNTIAGKKTAQEIYDTICDIEARQNEE